MCVTERFCSLSPYVLVHDGMYRLYKNDSEMCAVDIINIKA